jgi:pyruvate/2-oxoglutarate dehydrogenase complex dihydrolipoamide dehydrogenase (E3) component
MNHVIKERATVLTHDAAMDFAASKGKSMILNRISSAIVAPLLHNDEILGVAVVGPNASDLIAEATLAIEMGAVFEDLALTIHSHPTLPEGLKEAVLAAKGEAIHALNAPMAGLKGKS